MIAQGFWLRLGIAVAVATTALSGFSLGTGQSQSAAQSAAAKPEPTPVPGQQAKTGDPKPVADAASSTAANAATPATDADTAKLSPAKQKAKDQLAQDTARLYELANELKVEMDKSTKDTLSLNVIRKADEVEKMAKKVRAEMKANMDN